MLFLISRVCRFFSYYLIKIVKSKNKRFSRNIILFFLIISRNLLILIGTTHYFKLSVILQNLIYGFKPIKVYVIFNVFYEEHPYKNN